MIAVSLSFLFGLIFGSFANVVILRLKSKKKGILLGHSECPKCKTRLRWWELVPVISWLFLRGKCAHCQKSISLQYPLVEIALGILWGLAAIYFPVDLSSTWQDWLRLSLVFTSLFSLLVLTVYDLKYLEIPDQVSLPTIILLVLFLPLNLFASWQSALLGAAIPLLFFGGQIVLSQGRFMGGGDLRLGVLMGLLLGWQQILLALFLAYVCGAVWSIPLLLSKRKSLHSLLPFGPFLALGTMISLFWGEQILNWYLGLLGY